MAKKIKYALFNVTNLIDNNPGCEATVLGLKYALKLECTYQFPLGMGYHYFSKKKSFFEKEKPFEEFYLELRNNPDYIRFINSVDTLIINSEGTIHSDSIGAKTLLSFARMGKEMNKKVCLVNGSYYNLGTELLSILKKCDSIFVREEKSYNYLLNNNVKTHLVPDCAFLTKFTFSKKENNKCLFTPGVIFSHGEKKKNSNLFKIIKRHFDEIKVKFDIPVFLLIEESERELSNYWKELGGEVIDSSSYNINQFLEKISQFNLVISGRYHILLFAIMCNVNTIPLSSNTPKIGGLYSTFGEEIVNLQDCFTEKLDINNPINVKIDIDSIYKDIISSYSKLII